MFFNPLCAVWLIKRLVGEDISRTSFQTLSVQKVSSFHSVYKSEQNYPVLKYLHHHFYTGLKKKAASASTNSFTLYLYMDVVLHETVVSNVPWLPVDELDHL